MKTRLLVYVCVILLSSCKHIEHQVQPEVDILIHSGQVFTGNDSSLKRLNIGVCGDRICELYAPDTKSLKAKKIIDASGYIVSPGFIDPHTHSLSELTDPTKNANVNYLTQGVTTVVNGNDGGGTHQIDKLKHTLQAQGIGTNVAFFVGHGSVRKAVMGKAKRTATDIEIKKMQALVKKAMQSGALGFSSGLYYVPQTYADTQEVIALAKIAAEYGGIYETHLRDEGTFSIGIVAAVEEAILIAKTAKLPLHIAHIKALGVDAWGESKPVIQLIEQARLAGLQVTADQYPWLASGTKLHNAIMPKWAMADSTAAFHKRLNTAELQPRLQREISENLRMRGGADALLITACKSCNYVGKTLANVSESLGLSAIDTAIKLVQQGDIRVASFNMAESDLTAFMTQPWVVTSSDGTNGHPRKYASFAQKYHQYVKTQRLLTIPEFLYRSSTLTANILGLSKRGKIEPGYIADLIVFDPDTFHGKANYQQWDRLSTGVNTVLINGQIAIIQGQYTGRLNGGVLRRH